MTYRGASSIRPTSSWILNASKKQIDFEGTTETEVVVLVPVTDVSE